ncbi:MAG: anti-sigma factor [Pseudomonadota bacterium]
MTFDREKLSGFLDGELTPAEMAQIEAALENDAQMQAELEQLIAADALAAQEYEAILREPVPLALAAAVRNAPVAAATPTPANNNPRSTRSTPLWASIAAALCLFVGAAAGYLTATNTQTQIAATPSWLTQIADYHRVYASQNRHLVEVAADEADHIETWLTNTVGASVAIPDLTAHDLEFQGGRLLVAAGKPVAQLMYRDADGKIVALCLIANPEPDDAFRSRRIAGFDMVTWGTADANVVLVGDEGRTDLESIARTAAQSV